MDTFEQLFNLPLSENEKLIPWLKENIYDLDPRYIFELARRIWHEDT